MRWGDFVRIDEYVPGERLLISYCRPPPVPGLTTQAQQKVSTDCPIMCIRAPKSGQMSLVLHHTPDILVATRAANQPGGMLLSTRCLSIEKIFSCVSKQYALYKLNALWKDLKMDSFFQTSATLDEGSPFLIIKPFHECSVNELIKISVDPQSGKFRINFKDLKLKTQVIHPMEILLNERSMNKFIPDFHKLRCTMYQQRCRRSVLLQPVESFNRLAISNYDSHLLSRLPPLKLYLKFTCYTDYCLVVTFDVDHSLPDKPIQTKFYLLKLKTQQSYMDANSGGPEKNAETFKKGYVADCITRLDAENILKCHRKQTLGGCLKRKDLEEDEASQIVRCKKRKTKYAGDPSFVSSDYNADIFSSNITSVVSTSSFRIPYIELCQQLSRAKVTFNGLHENSVNYVMHLLDFPKLTNCKYDDTLALKDLLTNCTVHMDMETSMWKVSYYFQKPPMQLCVNIITDAIEFTYRPCYLGGEDTDTYLVDRMLADWRGLVKIYEHAHKCGDVLTALEKVSGITDFKLTKYDMKALYFNYSSYTMTLSFNSTTEKYIVNFSENGSSSDKCPHYLTQCHLTNEFNDHNNLQYMLKIIHDTYNPLKVLRNIHVLPAVANKVLSVVNNFTVIAHSSTHVKVIYRNDYILDIYFMESSVMLRDGTFYRTDSTKAMRGFHSIGKLTSFLELFADRTQMSHENPITPGNFDTESEPTITNKELSIKSPAIGIASPYQPYNAPSPIAVPSPAAFLQPSPAPVQNVSIMSPSSWPGSPPYIIQGSPHPSRGTQGAAQSRQLLSSINITRTTVPVTLTHAGFSRMLEVMDHPGHSKSQKVSHLESFFGSLSLRNHLIRVFKLDETVKIEKHDSEVVVFAGSGKLGPEPGLQYTVQLNPATLRSLVLKVTMMNDSFGFQSDDLKVLQDFFEHKVVRPPHKPDVLTAFIRILGAQPKLIKDFVRIMRLELQTDWTDFKFRVEWCLTLPPYDKPFIAIPGTPAVVLRSKNLIYLQITEVANENNTVTVALIHDMKTNFVQYFDFLPDAGNIPPEQHTWAVRARTAIAKMLARIAEQIAKKDQPIYCAVITILKRLVVG